MNISLRFLLLLLPIILGVIGLVLLNDKGGSPRTKVVLAGARAQGDEPVRIPTPEERAFEQQLEEIGASLDGTVGIAVTDVALGVTWEFNGLEPLPQQSVSKLWVAMAALARVDAGKLDLDAPATIRREDLTLFHQPLREIVRTRGRFDSDFGDLMELALARSDNTANDRLLREAGGAEVVQDWLDDQELAGIRFGADERRKQSAIAGLTWHQSYSSGRAFYEARDRVPEDARRRAFEAYLANPIDGASPVGIAEALAKLARGELLSQRSTTLIRAILAETQSGPRRIKAGAPQGWRVEHKTGTGQVFDGEQSGYNDVGILTAPDGSEYAIAVMIGRTREPIPRRMEMMQAVSRATAAFHESRMNNTRSAVFGGDGEWSAVAKPALADKPLLSG